MSKHNRERHQKHQLIAALSDLAEVVGFLKGVPFLRPRPGKDLDQMEFDRLVCERGITEFLRPALPSDAPAGQLVSGSPELLKQAQDEMRTGPNSAVLVREIARGVRARFAVTVHWPHEMN